VATKVMMAPRLISATLPTLLALIVNGGCSDGTRMLEQEAKWDIDGWR
jgi:hypothetical protein